MDLGTLLFLGFLWFLFNLLRQGGVKRPSAPPQPLPLPPEVDATQREGSQLEILLRDLGRSLEQVTGAKVAEEDEEERESLEVVPEIVSLEADAPRPSRVMVDHDDLAEQVEARRIVAAEARSGALTKADHRMFDKRIREQPADHTAVRAYTPEQLRNAIVWREILGPPRGLTF